MFVCRWPPYVDFAGIKRGTQATVCRRDEAQLLIPPVEPDTELVKQAELPRETIRLRATRERHDGPVADRTNSKLHLMKEDVLVMAGGASDDSVLSTLEVEPQFLGELDIKDADVRA
jgi:hypothetical protein